MDFLLNPDFISKVEAQLSKNPFAVMSRVIYNALYKEIVDGRLLPEHSIIESKIADQLKISRSPVKMALSEMEEAGILERSGGKKLRVKKITYEDCLWIYEARMSLEPEAAYLAAKRIRQPELLEISKLITRFEDIDKSKDHVEYTHVDKLFHEAIINASRNKYFYNMYRSIELPLALYRNQLNQLAYDDCFSLNDLEKGSSYHKSIYQMLELRLPLLAQDEMKNDIKRMYGTLSRLKT